MIVQLASQPKDLDAILHRVKLVKFKAYKGLVNHQKVMKFSQLQIAVLNRLEI